MEVKEINYNKLALYEYSDIIKPYLRDMIIRLKVNGKYNY